MPVSLQTDAASSRQPVPKDQPVTQPPTNEAPVKKRSRSAQIEQFPPRPSGLAAWTSVQRLRMALSNLRGGKAPSLKTAIEVPPASSTPEQSTSGLSSERRIQTHNVDTLPSIEQYRGTDEATKVVGQGDVHILACANSEVDGLYTFGASTCLILVAVLKDEAGEPEHVAMSHVDGFVRQQALDQLFSRLAVLGKTEISLLAGHGDVATLALNAADKVGAQVVFADAGHVARGSSFSAAVDRHGKVYFGNRPSLKSQLDKTKTLGRISAAIKSGNKLPIDQQLNIDYYGK